MSVTAYRTEAANRTTRAGAAIHVYSSTAAEDVYPGTCRCWSSLPGNSRGSIHKIAESCGWPAFPLGVSIAGLNEAVEPTGKAGDAKLKLDKEIAFAVGVAVDLNHRRLTR